MEASISSDKPKGKNSLSDINPVVKWMMLGLSVASILVALLIRLGWIPLGERANILRSNINLLEWTIIVLAVIFGVACLRAYLGLQQGESSGIAYTQWLSFITIFIGGTIIASVVIPGLLKVNSSPIPEELPPSFQVFLGGLMIVVLGVLGIIYHYSVRAGLIGRSIGNTLNIPVRSALLVILVGFLIAVPANLVYITELTEISSNIRVPEPHRLISGLILFILGLFIYRQVTSQVEEESDELRRAIRLTPGKFLQVQLAAAPSAGAIIGFIAIFLAFTMATDLFLRPTSVASVLTNVSTKGVIAIGVTILMISGEFDLSVGSILGAVAMFFMQFMTGGAPILGVLDPLPAAALAVFIGGILGFINGFILVTTGIPSFIVTLGTMLAYRAISLVAIAGGRILRYKDYYDDFPQVTLSPYLLVILAGIGLLTLLYIAIRTVPNLWISFSEQLATRTEGDFGTTKAIWGGVVALAMTTILTIVGIWLISVALHHISHPEPFQAGFFDIVNGRWEGELLTGTDGWFSVNVPRDANFRMAIIWWLIFVVIFNVILTSTPYGNAVFAVGGNVGAARAQGINVAYVKVFNFVLVAVMTSIAAIYEVARNPGVDPLKGNQWELEVIAMTVIGGALLTGGYGSIFGSLLGALIFGMLQTGLVLVGIESRLFTGTIGIVIIVAVVLNTTVRGSRKS